MNASTPSPDRCVATIDDLIAACRDTGARRIIVNGKLENAPCIRLAPGQALLGGDDHASIAFADDVDGLQLTTDNEVGRLRLTTSPDKRVIFNDTQVAGLGRMRLAAITAVGQVQILARDAVMSGQSMSMGSTSWPPMRVLAATGPTASASTFCKGRSRCGICSQTNVSSLPPSWSVCRRAVKALPCAAAVSSSAAPVLRVGDSLCRCSNSARFTAMGGIAEGTPDQITGGVFTVYNAHVDEVRNRGPVVTYGVNDMVLDNWGVVDRWTAEQKLTSYGRVASAS